MRVSLWLRGLSCAALAVSPSIGSGGDWTTSSSISVGATYSDNAQGSDEASESGDELFLEVRPSFSLSGEGARVQARGFYSPSIYAGVIGDTGIDWSHFLNASGNVELVPDSLFLDVSARASMVTQDPTGPGAGFAGDYLYGSDNLTQAFGASATMRGVHHLGQTADVYANTSLFSFNSGDQGAISNSITPSVDMGIKSGVAFPRMPWGISYQRSEQSRYGDNADDSNDSYQSITGNVSYVVSPTWRVNASLGYRDDSYQTSRSETSGVTWRGGATWTPNERVSLDVGYGYDYFGNSWSLDYRYSHKRISWFASYSVDLTTAQQEFLSSRVFALTDANGLPVIDPTTGRPILVTQLDPRLTDESYVLSSFRTGIDWSGVRTRMGLDINWNERQYELSGNDQTDWGVGLRASRDLSPELTASASLSYTGYEEQDTAGNDISGGTQDSWTAAMSLSKTLGRQSSVSGTVQHRNNAYGSGGFGTGSSGDENRVSVFFNHTF